MSLLEDLINKYCPDGVEYKTLSKLGSFYAGLNGKNKDDFKDGNAKYITYMNVFSNLSVNLNINDTVQINEKEKQNIVKYGDVIFTGSSETREECGMSSVLTKEPKEKLYLNSFCFGFRFNDKEIMLPDFSKYLFRSIELRKKIIKTASGVTRYNVSKKKMETISIPLPPIEVQKEIAHILDTFTVYQDCINEELTLRKKQYEYYRDKLLTFKNNMEYKTLSELGSFYAGLNGKNKDDFKDGNAKYITYMNVFSNLSVNLNINDTVQINEKEKQNIVKYGDVIFTGSSETREECGMSSVLTKEPKEKLYLNSFCFGFRFNDKEIMLPDFSKYLFRSTELRKKIIKTASGVTRFNVSKKKMERILIPVPPLEEQERIVKILDRFDALCNDISSGLPAEIEMRKKQYEYYRDKLLTFKEKKIKE